MPGPDELSTYVTGRWPAVVRTLVLLGAPPAHAADLADEVMARLLDRCADDDWIDLDVVLADETVSTWDEDRTAWWRRLDGPDAADGPDGVTGDVLVLLDDLTPGERARAVVPVALGLTADQVREALGPAGPGPARAVPTELPLAALGREGDPGADDLRPGGVRGRVEQRRVDRQRSRRRSRRRTSLAVVAAPVLALTVVAVLDQASRAGPTTGPTRAVPPPTSRVVEPPVPAQPPDPVGSASRLPASPWYDGRRVHLASRSVRVPGLRALALAADGVVATDRAGRVLHVRDDGRVEVLGRADRSGTARADGSVAAWTDRGEVVLQRLPDGRSRASGRAGRRGPPAGVRVPMPPGASVVAVDGGSAYVATDVGSFVVDLEGRAAVGTGRVLDAAAGSRLVRGPDGLTVVPARGPELEIDGTGGVLSPDARLALVDGPGSRADAPATRLHALAIDGRPLSSPQPVALPLAADRVVRDRAFGSDDLATFVLQRPEATPYLSDGAEGPRDEYPGYDLVVCSLARLAAPVCETTVEVLRAAPVPLLAR